MSSLKNRGGRPQGSGQHDYRRELDAVADILIKDPSMTPRAAMLQVLKKSARPNRGAADGGLRTLQRRWQRQGEERLAAARERRAERYSARSRSEWASVPQPRRAADLARLASGNDGSISAAMKMVADAEASLARINLPDLSRAAQMATDAMAAIDRSGLRSAVAAIDGSGLRSAMAQLESPMMRMVQEHQERMDQMRDLMDPLWRYRERGLL